MASNFVDVSNGSDKGPYLGWGMRKIKIPAWYGRGKMTKTFRRLGNPQKVNGLLIFKKVYLHRAHIYFLIKKGLLNLLG